MKLLGKIGREFSGYNILESAKRLRDRKPLQCSLYVTDQCNLDCAYCTEYDNSRPHPSIDDLKKWVRKIRELGTMRIALVGGEQFGSLDPCQSLLLGGSHSCTLISSSSFATVGSWALPPA